MVTEPLVILMLLMAPLVLVLGPRLLAFTARGLIVLVVTVALMVLIPMIFRARRYARAPVQFAQLYASDNPISGFLFWRPLVFYTEGGEEIRFKKRLAPLIRLRPNRAYIVYYLEEPEHKVLLSFAPVEHPDAAHWQPSTNFYARQARRR